MRYKYQALFDEIGEKGQKALESKTVTVAGIGGVGSAAAMLFARSGINLRLVDKDRIYEDELQRLSIFNEEHINKFKAKEAKKLLEKVNTKVKVKTFHEELIPSNVFLLDSDVVLDCTNDYKTSEIIEKSCKKPLIVCRYSADSGIIFHRSPKHNLKKLKSQLDKEKPIKDVGIFSPTVFLAASILVSEAIKILLKKKSPKCMINFNSWNHSIKVQK